ncbi:MAG: MotA/TolQ/ExbB proton channel family protein [Kiloniellales bacterium]|nr:MotA/TolQ/ExbB proton channel family protein [Kiloniellales bacterium]
MVDVVQAYPNSEAEERHSFDKKQREGGGQAHIAWILARVKGDARDEHRSLLVMRFALLNVLAFALLGVAYSLGFVHEVIAADRTYLSVGIFMVFLLGLVFCGVRIWQTSHELDKLRNFDPLVPSKAAEYISLLRGTDGDGRGLLASALRLKLTQRIAMVRQAANSLVLLGLIGTVIGFVIALSGVDPEQASNVKAIAPMVSTMIDGMSTALYTTLVGAILNIWLLANHQLLTGGTVKLITGLIEFGEVNARS